MKKKFIPLLFSFLLVSCINSDNYGFPSRVTFNRKSGTIICSGTSECYYVGISDYKGDEKATNITEEGDTIIVTNDWLSVKFGKYTDDQLKKTAQPNTTGRKQTLYVCEMVDDSFPSRYQFIFQGLATSPYNHHRPAT